MLLICLLFIILHYTLLTLQGRSLEVLTKAKSLWEGLALKGKFRLEFWHRREGGAPLLELRLLLPDAQAPEVLQRTTKLSVLILGDVGYYRPVVEVEITSKSELLVGKFVYNLQQILLVGR